MMHLKAHVTMPDMQISDDSLDFGVVRCGECRVVIVQLHNYQQVKCEWNSLPTEKEKKKVSQLICMKILMMFMKCFCNIEFFSQKYVLTMLIPNK
ncbi:hypothetical protein DPMN_180183 [Dreissena polymorpha]|uniref:Uncharacterized protein n=1 Tax=Dreissena polymorpha TaxID=45954 RepID=A0A9D4IP65_DREPO|nr:hypothetical protein DPMN_180183 [Dreissena polymorpha]